MRMTIWHDVPVFVKHKYWHIRKIGKRPRYAFAVDFGDVPVVEIDDNCKGVPVHNPRGRAYATRKDVKHRKGYRRHGRKTHN